MRAILGTLRGALIGLAAALILCSPIIIRSQTEPFFYWWAQSDPLNGPGGVLTFATIVGTFIGLLAGLASSLPPSGVSFLRSLLIIGIVAAVFHIFALSYYDKYFWTGYLISYGVTIVAALLTTIVLILVGYQRPLVHVLPSIALAVFLVITLAANIECRIFFPAGASSHLSFTFGWPASYFNGLVPGPGLHGEDGPEYVEGHSSDNSALKLMATYRSRYLNGLSATPWGMSRHGHFHPRALAINFVFAVLLSPLIWFTTRLFSSRLGGGRRLTMASGKVAAPSPL